MAPEKFATGKVHNVKAEDRHELLKTSKGDGDIILDLRGAKHLPPEDQAVIAANPAVIDKAVQETLATEVREGSKGPLLVDATPPWFYNPGNPMSSVLPASVSASRYATIVEALGKIDRKMGFTWHPERKIWQLWYHKPGFTPSMPWTNGWVMMKEFEPYRNTAYILEVVRYMDMASRGKSLKQIHDQVRRDRITKREKARARRIDRDAYIAGEVYDFTSIKNYGKGNKSVNYHS